MEYKYDFLLFEGYAYFEEAYCRKTRDALDDSWKGRGRRGDATLFTRATSVYRARVSGTFRFVTRSYLRTIKSKFSDEWQLANPFTWIFVGSKNRRREKYRRAKVKNGSTFNRQCRVIAERFRRVFLRTSLGYRIFHTSARLLVEWQIQHLWCIYDVRRLSRAYKFFASVEKKISVNESNVGNAPYFNVRLGREMM